MTDFKVFQVAYGEHEYTAQFDFDALRKADEAGIIEMSEKNPLAFAANVFYHAVLKNHPHTNRKRVLDFAYKIIEDEEYGYHAFDDICEDFIVNFTKYLDEKDPTGKVRKKFTAVESPKVINLPKESK